MRGCYCAFSLFFHCLVFPRVARFTGIIHSFIILHPILLGHPGKVAGELGVGSWGIRHSKVLPCGVGLVEGTLMEEVTCLNKAENSLRIDSVILSAGVFHHERGS